MKHTKNLPTKTLLQALALFLLGAGYAHAQDSNLIISPATAAAVKSDPNFQNGGLTISDSDIRAVTTAGMLARPEIDFEHYSNDEPSTFEIAFQNEARVSLGVLSDGTDTADGLTRHDPYAIENVEVSPLYPEGIYVEEMSAAAGLGLTSKF